MMGIWEVASGPVVSAPIVAALYVATYLSFLRLLSYPRNWVLPPLSGSLVTAGLATVTVGFVSISPDGLDLGALLASTGFIVVLFAMIAAPAVDFRPGTWSGIGLLAKHGDYFGLWMIPPALVAGYLAPSIKLQTILVVALAIEIVWFLRTRRTDRGRVFPFGSHDQLVLETQAKGDIKGFAKRHGIRELVLEDGAVGWRGCGKETAPCPMNLYLHHLGLNTAPCCREHMKDLGHYVASCLKDMGAVHWIDGGSLLGAVRENGQLLAWEDDVDVSVLLDSTTTWESLVAGISERGARDGYFVDVFKDMGYIAVSFDPPGSWPFRWERNRMRGEIRLDLVAFRHAVSHGQAVVERRLPKGAAPLTENGWYGVPQETVIPTSTIAFLGGEIACPQDSDAYLRILYGDYEEVDYTYVDPAAAETRRHADQLQIPAPAES